MSLPTPPAKPENTGSPTAPSAMYTATAMLPRLPPKSSSAVKTAKVCMVKGMAAGTDSHEQTDMSTAIRAM